MSLMWLQWNGVCGWSHLEATLRRWDDWALLLFHIISRLLPFHMAYSVSYYQVTDLSTWWQKSAFKRRDMEFASPPVFCIGAWWWAPLSPTLAAAPPHNRDLQTVFVKLTLWTPQPAEPWPRVIQVSRWYRHLDNLLKKQWSELFGELNNHQMRNWTQKCFRRV